MEFLISQWSIESHTFTAAWGKSCPTLEDVVALNGLPVFWQAKTIRLFEDPEEIVPDEADKKKLEALKNAFSNSKSSSKSMYALQARHFIFWMETGNDIKFEAMLSYWLSWYVLPSGPEDGLNP